ncbi:hypothetical protein ACIBL3_29105 [Kribbella sp. NPDC050124]|uniref:hypothetical protein n=1 Tax=Kribbella sp. NPDC050124 TaxID=3364114 RepID=UPI0037A8EF3E
MQESVGRAVCARSGVRHCHYGRAGGANCDNRQGFRCLRELELPERRQGHRHPGVERGLWKTNWDKGDAVITPKVHLGQSNTLNANLYCSATRTRRGMYVYATNRTFTPTANNQTFWL